MSERRKINILFLLLFRADGTCRHVAAVLFDIEYTVHVNSQQSSTSKECTWKRRAKPNEKSCSLEELKIAKAEYGKTSKQPLKPTSFDPTSVEFDHNSFMECLKTGLEKHVPSAVVLQVLPQAAAVEVAQADLTTRISNDQCVEHEEETTAVQVNTISALRDAFLKSKGIDDSRVFEVTKELCVEFQNYIKLHVDQDQAAMIFEKTRSQGNCSFWMEQRSGRITGSNFYRICHLRESTNKDSTLKDLLGYCPVPTDKQPIQFEWGHEKESSAVELYFKKLQKAHKKLCISECGLIVDPEFPHLGSSPDRMRFCHCCGKRVVEVKSLFAKRSLMPHIAAADYIYMEEGVYKLKRETKWNYQIQGEMALSKVKKADLVIYTNKGIMVIDVPFDEQLWQEMLVKLNKFYSDFMIPELLTQRIKNLY